MILVFNLILQASTLGFDELGSVWPDGTLPVSNSITNAKKTSDYTFTFYLDHSLPKSASIHVEFPYQYKSGLGISSCSASLGSCSISNTTVKVSLSSSIYRFKTTSLIIFQVQNPEIQGGTGNFRISTYENSNLIDRNFRFGIAGISQEVGKLLSGSVNVVEDDELLAGAKARFEFKFRAYRVLPAWSWVRFSFPDNGFEFAARPTCTGFEVEGFVAKGNFSCVAEGNRVSLYGISEDVPEQAYVGFRVTARNPQFSVKTGSFCIETGKNLTLTVYDEILEVEGLTIKPGKISQVLMEPWNDTVVLSQGKEVVYRIQFLLSNVIYQGGSIEIVGTSEFEFSGYYLIESGIYDASEVDEVTFEYDSGTFVLNISNFADLKNEVISLLISFTNPLSSGVTDPLIIRSYNFNGDLIDENNDQAFVFIESLTSPLSPSVTFPSGSSATGSTINLKLSFTPQFEVPSLGWVVFSVPYGFQADSYTQTCFSKPTYESEASSPSCYFKNGQIFVQLFKDSTGIYGKFETGESSYVRITSLISSSKAGKYFFDFSTYDTEMNLLESGTASGSLTASSLTATVSVMHAGIATPTVMEISFTVGKALFAGRRGAITTDPVSYIEIEFPTSTGSADLFSTTLGLSSSSVPCKSIQGFSDSILCTITTSPSSASSSTPVVVTVSNFDAIPSSTSLKLHLAGITYVQTSNSDNLKLTTYQISNHIRSDLESGSASFTAGVTMPSKSSYSVTLTLSNKQVQSSTTLSTGTSFTNTVASGATTPYLMIHIYKTHDEGYCKAAALTCKVDSVALSCDCYAGADIILIKLTSSFVAGSHTMQIAGLINPQSVPSGNDDLLFYVLGGGSVLEYASFSGAIPKLEPGHLDKVKISLSDNRKESVFVLYSVVLAPQHDVPDGGSIQIEFPEEFELDASSPTPTCYSNYLHPVGEDVECSLDGNVFTLTGFVSVPAGNVVVIWAKGVKNPQDDESSQFVIRTLNQDSLTIDEDSKSGTISFTPTYTVSDITSLDISIFPTNANSSSEYIFTFTPSTLLGAGSILKIDFPLKQFGSLPSSPTCRLTGDITTYSTCTTSASDLYITTDKDLPYKSLSVSIIGLKNFDAGTSDNFAVTTSFDGTTVQSTSSDTSKLTVVTTAQAGTLQVSNILFSPQNEAEKATYEFYFNPVYGISASQNVVVKFPSEFDHRIGDKIDCWAEGLKGFLECSLLHAWVLIVKKHDSFEPCSSCSVVLYVSGVYNPRQGRTGQFLVGVLDGSTFVELNEFAGTVLVMPSPEYLEILSTAPSSLFSRQVQDISFNITCNETIPTTESGGQIWVDFPSDYILTDSFITCSSSQVFASGTPKCSTQYTKVIMEGQTTSYSGNLKVTVEGLPNPLYDILADYITVEVADTFHSLILARSYPNLDPNRFQYTYPGPLLIVNDNKKFYVRRGTYSKFIFITLDYPAALNLTLTPKSESFVFVPEQISLFVGDMKASFRVSVPFDTEDKEYIISWGIAGEMEPAYYTPLLKSKFEVTKDDLVKVSTEEIMPIPKGYSSLPVYIELDQAPNQDLSLHLTLPDSITGVELSSETLEFAAGVYTLNFSLSVNQEVSSLSSKVSFTLSGTNAEAFYLSKSSISFQILESSPKPEVLGAGVIKTTRTTGKFTIATSIYCWVYFAYALRGTSPPSFKETKSQGPASYPTTKTRYGSIRVSGSTTQTFTISGLEANTRYSLFMWAQDLTGVQSESFSQLDFDTDNIFKTSQVKLKFTQMYLNDVEIQKTSAAIQLYLSLHDWRVIKNVDSTLQMDPNKVYSIRAEWPEVAFYIIDKVDSEDYPSPLLMIKRLQGFQDKFEEKLNNFDSSFKIYGSEVNVDRCKFNEYPHVVNETSDYRNITISASIEEDGFIYAIALIADQDPGTPFAFQVFEGNDMRNRPTLVVYKSVDADNQANLTFTQVNDNTTYHLYVICTNNNPGYVEKIDDSKVVKIKWTTDPKPPRSVFSINFSASLAFALTYLIF